jgi:predicted nucleic acid-binding Zn ribbon protein
MSDKPIHKCPECGKNKVKRHIGAGMGIIFKGSGFYETDYKRSDNAGTGGRTAQNNTVKDGKKEEPSTKTEAVKTPTKENNSKPKEQRTEKDNKKNE